MTTEHDRKKRLYELRDAHLREKAAGKTGRVPARARPAGTDINTFLREIVSRKRQRKQQRAIVQDFLANPTAYGVDAGLVAEARTMNRPGGRRGHLEQQLEVVRRVLDALESELAELDGVSDADGTGARNRAADVTLATGPTDAEAGSPQADREVRPCRLEVLVDGEKQEDITLTNDKLIIGRRSVNDICLRDRSVSGRHALLVPDGAGRWSIVDLGSTNGTQVNGLRVDNHTLRDRDEILMGRCQLIFHDDADGDQAQADDADGDQAQADDARKFQSTVVIDQKDSLED